MFLLSLLYSRAGHSLFFSRFTLFFSILVANATLWCGVAQLVARRLAGRQARVRFPARHHREVFPTDPQAMRRWREASANVLYECDWMIVYCMNDIKYKNKQKEWHSATKPLGLFTLLDSYFTYNNDDGIL
jgi:hypothetical protein